MLTQHKAASRDPLIFWTVSGLISDSWAMGNAWKDPPCRLGMETKDALMGHWVPWCVACG